MQDNLERYKATGVSVSLTLSLDDVKSADAASGVPDVAALVADMKAAGLWEDVPSKDDAAAPAPPPDTAGAAHKDDPSPAKGGSDKKDAEDEKKEVCGTSR